MCVSVTPWQQAILLDKKLSSKWMNALWIGGCASIKQPYCIWVEWSSLVDKWNCRTIRLSKASRTMGSHEAPGAPMGPWHISNHRGGGEKYAYMHRFIFPFIHLHTYCRYTHGHTDVSFPCVCILRVKKTFIFSERSAEAEAVQSHFVFPADGRKQWPLRPCDEFRVHFLQFPFFMHAHRIQSKKRRGMQLSERKNTL